MNLRLLPPRSNTLPGVFKLATRVSGAVPNMVKLFARISPLPLPFNDKLFSFLLAGIEASSAFGVADVAGAKKLYVKLYKAIRAVGAVATVVNVPPRAPPETVPIPRVGAIRYPKPGLVTVNLVNCLLLPIKGVAEGQHPAGKDMAAPPNAEESVRVGAAE